MFRHVLQSLHMIVHFVTSNKGKVRNARRALREYGIQIKQIEMELAESRSEDPKDIALEKAEQAFKALGKPVIVEDSGFFIRALNGFPMTHVKFSLKTIGIEKILKMLEDVKDRRAEWRMTVAYVYGPGKHRVFTFVEKGKIATESRPVKRKMMSDYWRLYIPTVFKGNELALCEMTSKQLKDWTEFYASHNQFRMFGEWYVKHSKR